jgi:hypothetical protein
LVLPPLDPEKLLDLYRIAVDEYRFEVKLNWDRTAFYFSLNSALVTVGGGLLRFGGAPLVDLLAAALFLIGLSISLIGAFAIKKGHEYYRNTIVQKTVIEDRLGLTRPLEDRPSRPTLTIGTTAGQKDQWQILHNPDAWLQRPLRRGSVTFWIVKILYLFSATDVAGLVVSLWLCWRAAGADGTVQL